MQPSDVGLESHEPYEISLRGRGRIVLAEDDADLREMIATLLRNEGYQVVEARHGLELIDLVESSVRRSRRGEGHDLIISDVRMPGVTGLGVLGRLRRSDWGTPVILISAFVDDEIRAQGERLGAVVLDKPLDIRALLRLAKQHAGDE